MLEMEIGGAAFQLNPAAISAVRYRAEYGESIVVSLGDCTSYNDMEGKLLRLCHQMIPPAQRPPLLDFARLARRDAAFQHKAQTACDALLKPDDTDHVGKSEKPFDEYDVLALMTAAGMDMALIYELPILHLAAIARRCFELKNPGHKTYHEMSGEELAVLYPGGD